MPLMLWFARCSLVRLSAWMFSSWRKRTLIKPMRIDQMPDERQHRLD